MTPPSAIEPSLRETSAPAPSEHHLDRLLSTVGIAPLDSTGWLRITGEDRVRWLNGMVTNSIQALQPGEGSYSFALNAQGQIQGDLTTFAEPDALLVETARTQIPTLITHFDRFIIMDDVELEDISPATFGLLIAGPQAAQLLTTIGLEAPASVQLSRTTHTWQSRTVQIMAAHSPLIPRFELWSAEATRSALLAELTTEAKDLQGGPVDKTAIEHLRLLEGTPLFGVDIREKNLAQETAQTRALHFAKGCYLGQEIVERIRSRGNVNRTFTTFRLEGPLPAPGTVLTADDKPIGELTSTAAISPIQLGLAIVRREAIERSLTITYTTPQGPGVAIPTPSPVRTLRQLPASNQSERDPIPMAEQNKPFVVTDRRRHTLDGDVRPDADPSPAREARPETPPPAPVAVAPPEPEQSPDDALPPAPTQEQMAHARTAYAQTSERLSLAVRAANPGMEQMPPMSFEGLVQSVYMTAIMQLGGGTPEGQQPQVDLMGAQQSIAMLAVLSEKTQANLTADESALLDRALFELQVTFLEITQALARSAAAKQQQAQAPGQGFPPPPGGRPSIVR